MRTGGRTEKAVPGRIGSIAVSKVAVCGQAAFGDSPMEPDVRRAQASDDRRRPQFDLGRAASAAAIRRSGVSAHDPMRA